MWQISDGDINRESANGTWLSLTDYRIRKERTESEPMEIQQNSEIKISDVILKIEIFNGDNSSNIKGNNQELDAGRYLLE